MSAVIVLIVEDEFHDREVLNHNLKHLGATVEMADNGKAAIEKLALLRPHVVIMDLALPEQDGWQTLAAMRANPNTLAIPVIAMTAYHSVETEEDAHQAGFDGFYAKPIKRDILQGILQRYGPASN